MEEPTPVCSFFTNKYNQLQNQDNPSSSSGLQLSPRCQLKIGLFISFLTLSASFEVLLASSMGKSAFPNDSAVSDFLTKPLSKGHEHFTNGTVLGAVGFVLLLAIFIYFYRKIHEKKTEQVDPVLACRPKNAHKHFLECLMQPERTVQNLYEAEGINPDYWTFAGVPHNGGGQLFLGIPFEKYKHISCEKALDQELQAHASQYKGFHHYVIMPANMCRNLPQYTSRNSSYGVNNN